MHILWRYLRPLGWWIALSLLLAGVAQVLTLVDPLILGKLIEGRARRRLTDAVRGLVSLRPSEATVIPCSRSSLRSASADWRRT